jgi:hypothetical protein
VVKPLNPDDVPQFRGIDGLKKGSPLGIEPKGEGIQGPTGFSVTGQKSQVAPDAAPKSPVAPATADPKPKSATEANSGSVTTTSSNVSGIAVQSTPVAQAAAANVRPEPLKP